MQSQQLNCPKCGQVDLVQKVSAVVSSGTYTSTGTKTAMPSGQTDLSRRLASPQEPSGFPTAGCGGLVLVLVLLCFTAYGVYLVREGFWRTDAAEAEISQLSSKKDTDSEYLASSKQRLLRLQAEIPLRLMSACIPPFLAVLVVVFSINLAIQQSRKHRTEMKYWETAMQRWNELYYCGRDDGVFNPAESVFVPTANLQTYLHS